MAGVYREFAALPRAEEGLKDLWQEMALEEKDHAHQILLASRLPAAEAIRAPLIPLQRVELLHGKAQALLREVKARTLSQEVALRLSLRMEREFAVVHASCAVEFVEESMQALFRSLAAGDENHAEALNGYCKRAGISIGESGL